MTWDWEKLKDQQQGRRPAPPQVDEVLKTIKNIKIPGGPIVFLLLLVVLGIYSSVYVVDTDEVGVVQRFGKYAKTTQPGLNFKLPFGIETARLVQVRRILKEEFGFSSERMGGQGRTIAVSENNSESLMLTGDLNVAVVPWIVQYRVKDAQNYLFEVRTPDVPNQQVGTLYQVMESAVREVMKIQGEELKKLYTERQMEPAMSDETWKPDSDVGL